MTARQLSIGVNQLSAEQRRADAIEELACALRDRGVGSPEMTLLLAQHLRARDEQLEVELRIGALERQHGALA